MITTARNVGRYILVHEQTEDDDTHARLYRTDDWDLALTLRDASSRPSTPRRMAAAACRARCGFSMPRTPRHSATSSACKPT